MTELDLRHSLIPDELIEDLVKAMPAHRGPDLAEHRDVPKFDYVAFMQNMTDGAYEGGIGEESGSSSNANRAENGIIVDKSRVVNGFGGVH